MDGPEQFPFGEELKWRVWNLVRDELLYHIRKKIHDPGSIESEDLIEVWEQFSKTFGETPISRGLFYEVLYLFTQWKFQKRLLKTRLRFEFFPIIEVQQRGVDFIDMISIPGKSPRMIEIKSSKPMGYALSKLAAKAAEVKKNFGVRYQVVYPKAGRERWPTKLDDWDRIDF
jgi:hypothetical protein